MLTRRHLLGSIAFGLALPWHANVARAGFRIAHSEDEWRKLLTPDQYAVLREGLTENPFTSPLLGESRRGTYACVGCGLDLFSSLSKYETNTGWPSFWAPLRDAVRTKTDTSFHMVRTEVHCADCGCHIGHVFADGPKPTGLRYCMNGLALSFNPKAA